MEKVAPRFVEFDDPFNGVMGQSPLGVVGTNQIGVFTEHVHVKH